MATREEVASVSNLVQEQFLPIPNPGIVSWEILNTLVLKMFYKKSTIKMIRKNWEVNLEHVIKDNDGYFQIVYRCKHCGILLCDLNRVKVNIEDKDLDPIYYVGNNMTHSGRGTTLARLKRHTARNCYSSSRGFLTGRGAIRNNVKPSDQQQLDEELPVQPTGDFGPTTRLVAHSSSQQQPGTIDEDLFQLLSEYCPGTDDSCVGSQEEQEGDLFQPVDSGLGLDFMRNEFA